MAAFHLIIYGRFWVITEEIPGIATSDMTRSVDQGHVDRMSCCEQILRGIGVSMLG